MRKTKSKGVEEKMLTDVELELMTILWQRSEGTVAEVIEGLPKSRDLAYTSVSTILRILEQKGVLTTRKEGRGHIYVPTLKKSEYEAKAVRHVVDRVFQGTPVALIKQLLNTGGLEQSDLEELKSLINKQVKNDLSLRAFRLFKSECIDSYWMFRSNDIRFYS